MNFLDRRIGRGPEPRDESPHPATARLSRRDDGPPPSGQLTDDQAVERYRYLLHTAPPDVIEEAHAEAFAQLTPEQRRLVLEGLSTDLPPAERSDRDDPRSLARMATRAELRRPGALERNLDGMATGGMGMGGLMASSFLSTIAGVVIGTAVADAIFDDADGGGDSGGAGSEGDQGSDAGDPGADGGVGGYDSGGYDGGGGDFGGGGFGGGDFGGGDF